MVYDILYPVNQEGNLTRQQKSLQCICLLSCVSKQSKDLAPFRPGPKYEMDSGNSYWNSYCVRKKQPSS